MTDVLEQHLHILDCDYNTYNTYNTCCVWILRCNSPAGEYMMHDHRCDVKALFS